MSGSFGEMGNLLKQAQKMQKAMEEAREELRTTTVQGTAGGGVVCATVRGDGQVERIEVSEEVYRQSDKALFEEMILAAVRDGIERANRLSEERLSKVTGGLDLPGLM
jgi:DNA-binding YbaB/EbfC family protein